MIITASRLEIIGAIALIFALGAIAGALFLVWWRSGEIDLPDPAAAPAGSTISGSVGQAVAAGWARDIPQAPDVAGPPAAAQLSPLPHLGGPMPEGWETPAEQIDRLEAQLEALYAADAERIREESDRLALELLGDVRAVQEMLEAGHWARPDWLPELVST